MGITIIQEKKKYRTLEEDLGRCFEKRKIKVLGISVTKGATKYVIEVER